MGLCAGCCSDLGFGLSCVSALVGLIKTKMLGGNGDDTNDNHLFLP